MHRQTTYPDYQPHLRPRDPTVLWETGDDPAIFLEIVRLSNINHSPEYAAAFEDELVDRAILRKLPITKAEIVRAHGCVHQRLYRQRKRQRTFLSQFESTTYWNGKRLECWAESEDVALLVSLEHVQLTLNAEERRLLELLLQGSWTVKTIAAEMSMSFTKATRSLRKLKRKVAHWINEDGLDQPLRGI